MRALKHTPIAFAALLALGAFDAVAQPVPTQLPVLRPGGAVINASVGTPGGNALTVTQTTSASNRGLVEWQSFSIGSQARVNIAQPNAQSVLVNRVTGTAVNGPSASEIYGTLSANGRVFLVNPAGVVFGPGAQVSVGSLVATSLDLDSSMSANNYARLMSGEDIQLTGGASSVQVMAAADRNRPQIQVNEGGSIVLLSGEQLTQNGSISAPGGHINLSVGSGATLRPVGSSGFVEVLSVQPVAARTGAIAVGFNSQTIAQGGSIVIGAQPNEEPSRGDTITIAGLVSADASTGAAGSVHIAAGATGSVLAGEGAVITASSTGGAGGQVNLQGSDIRLQRGDVAHPRVLAEGGSGGGRIDIGNAQTHAIAIEQGTSVSADATQAGNGGSIAVRALFLNPNATGPVARIDYGVTEVYGTLQARGGTQRGDGGSIETSGIALTTNLGNPASGITQSATIDARARAAGGRAGAWTLDPFDVTISNAGPVAVNGSFNPTGPGANVRASDLSAALDAGTSIDISTAAGGSGTAAGDITIAAGTTITRSTGTAPTSLTLRANNNIVSNGAIIDASAAGPVSVNLYSDLDGNGSGSISLLGGRISTGGGSLTLSGGTDPSTGFARGDFQNAGVAVSRTTIDTRGSAGVGNVAIRGESGVIGLAPGVALDTDMTVGNLSVDGRASHGTAVLLNGANITTASGNITVRGVAVRTDTATSAQVGVDTGTLRLQLGSGSLILAGRGDAGTASGSAVGLSLGDVQISANTGSTGTITFAGQAAGTTVAPGIQVQPSGNTGLVISSDAPTAGGRPTGANVVIGASATVASSALDMTSGIGPNIFTANGVNIRPLGVDASGLITEQVATPITLLTTGSNAGAGTFVVNTNLLRLPGPSNGGISSGGGFVIGSQAHTGLINVDAGAFTQHPTVAVTLQNEGTGSQGITLGNGNTVGTLGLLTAGNVTQGTAGITTQNLVIRGGAASNVNLSGTTNQIGVLAFDPPASLTVLTPGNITVDAASAPTFNASTGAFTPLAITSSTGGNTALLQSTAGNVLINQSISMAGTGASQLNIVSPGSVTFATGASLSTSATGRWRVWAPTVINAPVAGPATNLYGCVFGDTTTCSVSNIALPTSGNQLLHPTQPTLSVAANPLTGYVDLALPQLTYVTTGLLNGDTAAGALSGTLAATPSGATTYAIGQGNLASPLGYNLTFTPSTLTLQPGITRHMLQAAFQSEMSSDVYGRNLDQPYICTAASVIRGSLADDKQSDPLASEWGKVRNQPQLSGCLNVSDGGQCSAF